MAGSKSAQAYGGKKHAVETRERWEAMAEPGCEKCGKKGPVIQLGVFFCGYEKRDDGYSYPAYDECTSRYLCRTCAEEVFVKCKDVFDRYVMGGSNDDANL